MIMRAIVIGVQNDRLFVLDIENRQRVVVITRRARRFRPGNFVRIEFRRYYDQTVCRRRYMLREYP